MRRDRPRSRRQRGQPTLDAGRVSPVAVGVVDVNSLLAAQHAAATGGTPDDPRLTA